MKHRYLLNILLLFILKFHWKQEILKSFQVDQDDMAQNDQNKHISQERPSQKTIKRKIIFAV